MDGPASADAKLAAKGPYSVFESSSPLLGAWPLVHSATARVTSHWTQSDAPELMDVVSTGGPASPPGVVQSVVPSALLQVASASQLRVNGCTWIVATFSPGSIR